MQKELLSQADSYVKKNTRRHIWKRLVSGLACIVVFCTTYALILPAITMENSLICGMEEHIHEEACYETMLMEQFMSAVICQPEIHQHTAECFDDEGKLICGLADQVIHIHDANCFDADGLMICNLPETEEHIHDDSCFSFEKTMKCAMEEEYHLHGETCFRKTQGELICQPEDPENHEHSDACYEQTVEVICGVSENPDGHLHGEDCYETMRILSCQLEQIAVHTHDEFCVDENGLWNCGILAACDHQHTAECLEVIPAAPVEQQELVCQLAVHAHAAECYPEMPGLGPDILSEKPEEEIVEEDPASDAVEEEVEDQSGLYFCEMTEHLHGEGCWDENSVFCCELVEHFHDTTCLIPPQTEEPAENYLCGMSAHIHEETCFDQDGLMFCFMEEHIHEVECFIPIEEETVEENYPCGKVSHTHEETCFDRDGLLICFMEEHIHEVECLIPIEEETEENYPCGKVSHIHEETCFDRDGLLICFMEEHIHEAECLIPIQEEAVEENYPCGKVSHIHEENCFDHTGLLICVMEEHTHSAECMSVTAQIFTDGTYLVPAEHDTTVITITGELPEDSVIKAFPVELDDVANTVLAYDITIFRADGTVFEPTDGNSLHVNIKCDVEAEEGATLEVFYIPEEGEPEPVETVVTDEGVSFEAPHFSVYALTVTGTKETVYLNGANGNDNAQGTQNSPVKTIERACELVAANGTIYISGTVTVNTASEWTKSGVTIRRASNFTGVLIQIASGGSLTLSDITIHGGSNNPSSSKIDTNSTYATGSAKAPLIVVNSGGSLVINEGATLTNNSNKPDVSSNKFVENGYVGQGGAIYCNGGTLTMNGGTIQQCEAESGGGIYLENSVFHLTGGLIDSNYARDIVSYGSRKNAFHRNAGGGVYVGDHSTMNMSGGTISNNQTSREGGGVSLGWLNHTRGAAISEFITTFNMTGGTFTGNTATSTGGGLNITAGRQAFISAGTFTNNTANGNDYQPSGGSSATSPVAVYSGGAIYLDAQQKNSSGNYAGKPGYAVINRVLIANNSATNWGGGIAACGTSTTSVNASVVLENGTAIYNNTATSSGKEMYLAGTIKVVSDEVLGGGFYNWSKSGYAYDNTLTDNSPAITEAKKLARVIITNNEARNGGGIGCNGVIEIGGESNTTSLSITKKWDNVGEMVIPAYIDVQIYRNGSAYGSPIRIYKAADGTWPTYYLDGLSTEDTFTIQEIPVPGFDSTVEQDGNKFVITNTRPVVSVTVKKKWADSDTVDHSGDSVTVLLYANGESTGKKLTLNEANGWTGSFGDLPATDAAGEKIEYTVEEENPAGYEPSYSPESTPASTLTDWTAATKLESGKTYRFVSSSGLALAADSRGSLVSAASDEDDPYQQWVVTETSGKWYFCNAETGKYIYLSQSYQSYTFSLSNSQTALTYSGNTLSGTVNSRTRYIQLSSSSVKAVDKSSSATALTPYVLTQSTTKPTITITVTNTPARYELPETGGIGRTPYTTGGLLLMAAAAILLLYSHSKRRKEDFSSS